jgi:hypothetical protein
VTQGKQCQTKDSMITQHTAGKQPSDMGDGRCSYLGLVQAPQQVSEEADARLRKREGLAIGDWRDVGDV